jgi:hypothetical protein
MRRGETSPDERDFDRPEGNGFQNRGTWRSCLPDVSSAFQFGDKLFPISRFLRSAACAFIQSNQLIPSTSHSHRPKNHRFDLIASKLV